MSQLNQLQSTVTNRTITNRTVTNRTVMNRNLRFYHRYLDDAHLIVRSSTESALIFMAFVYGGLPMNTAGSAIFQKFWYRTRKANLLKILKLNSAGSKNSTEIEFLGYI